jgi:hypothetical protein
VLKNKIHQQTKKTMSNSLFNRDAKNFESQKFPPNFVLTTRHYDYFLYTHGNRDIDESNYARLKRSISVDGQQNPIMVNEKGEVIDGQHRLAVCKELRLPVRFFIQPGATIATAVQLNTAGQKWNTNDWINHYAKQGNPHYQQLKKFAENSPFQITTTIAIAQGTLAQIKEDGANQNVKQGTWSCKDWDASYKLMKRMLAVKAYLNNSAMLYQIALIKFNRLQAFDWDRMMRQMETYPDLLPKVADGVQAIQQLDKLYNYKRTRHQVPLMHMYLVLNSSWAAKTFKAK